MIMYERMRLLFTFIRIRGVYSVYYRVGINLVVGFTLIVFKTLIMVITIIVCASLIVVVTLVEVIPLKYCNNYDYLLTLAFRYEWLLFLY